MHAYLIIAHHHFNQLKLLLTLLDDERNDLFVHIDEKVKNKKSVRELCGAAVRHLNSTRLNSSHRTDNLV